MMTSNLVERVNALSDSRAVKFLQYFNQGLLDAVFNDFEQLMQEIPKSVRSMPEFSIIDHLSLDNEAQIEGEEAVAIARSILTTLANNPRFSTLLEKALDKYRDMDQGGKEILAAGLAASMVILAATATEFQYKGDWGVVRIAKETATPELVQAVLKLGKPLLEHSQESR
jgi:predicted Zn-dependent protease with MMP-like domain